jgi:hypothetical protein
LYIDENESRGQTAPHNKSLDRSHRLRASHQSDPVLLWRVLAGGGPVNSIVRRLLCNSTHTYVTGVKIQIVRFLDPGQPGFVECSITDAWGDKHLFVEKVPVVTDEALGENSAYPLPSMVACDVIRRWRDSNHREIATIDTNKPWGIASNNGQTQFDVLVSALSEI